MNYFLCPPCWKNYIDWIYHDVDWIYYDGDEIHYVGDEIYYDSNESDYDGDEIDYDGDEIDCDGDGDDANLPVSTKRVLLQLHALSSTCDVNASFPQAFLFNTLCW